MIDIRKISNIGPYKILESYYAEALKQQQSYIEALQVSSYNPSSKEVHSRIVNLKYIIDDEWIFFSNYNSSKAIDFEKHDQISTIFFWSSINVQVRTLGHIKKTDKTFSDIHYQKRSTKKNILAISSNQSKKIGSYEEVNTNYLSTKNNKKIDLNQRPEYWGGYSFTPYYFEFWEGDDSRINKRKVYEIEGSEWVKYYLQP